MTRTPAARTTTVLVALALAVGGCSLGNEETPAPPTPPGVAELLDAGLPVERYLLTVAQTQLVARAVRSLVEPCMRAAGFSRGVPDLAEVAPGSRRPDYLDRRYADVPDRATARRHGYHRATEARSTSPDPALLRALLGRKKAGWINVAEGRTRYGGCVGKAERQLASGMTYVSPAVGAAHWVEVLARDDSATEDARVAMAQIAWSDCMQQAGHTVSGGPTQAGTAYDLTTARPSEDEVRAALVDVSCQEKSDLVRTWFEVESQYQRGAIDDRDLVFRQIREENALLVDRAATLLGEG